MSPVDTTYNIIPWPEATLHIYVACRSGAVCSVRFVRDGQVAPTEAFYSPASTGFATAAISTYLAGDSTSFDVPLCLTGTAFQTQVWAALQGIPHGTVQTYGRVAQRVGCPGGSRAVGGAVGKNPVAILVPCHRVVSSQGLGGFTGGVDIKKQLLRLEGIDTPYGTV